MMRKIVSMSTAVLLILSMQLSAFAASGSQIAVCLDGEQLKTGAFTIDGALFLPVRAVCEALGDTVTWTADAATVTISGTNKNVVLDFTNQKIDDNGHEYYIYGTYSEGCRLLDNGVYLESGLLSDCFGLSVQYDKSNTVFLTRLTENAIKITTMKLNSENDDLVVNLQYPQISGLANEEVQSQINQTLREEAVNAVNEGLTSAYDLKQTKEDIPDYTQKCGAYFNYIVKYNQNGLLSVVLLDYQYAGGAHGNTFQTAYTFDLSTGKVLELSDLMKSDSGYVNYINAAVRAEIDKRVAAEQLYEFEDSPFKTIGSDPYYYLSNSGVVIYFQEYAYFPYAAGIQEFTISYAGLANMLKSTYQFLSGDAKALSPNPAKNAMTVGSTGKVVLKGNPTTGYTWHVKIENGGIVKQVSEIYAPDSDLIGAGGTYTWTFKAFTKGQTKITFTYYRDSEGAASVTPENTAVYTVSVN